jgi:tRNA (guanosine-2'-O-)-methyltransferase
MKMKELTKQEKELLSHYLTRFITPERDARIKSVLDNRTRHFSVVLEDLYQTQNISAVLRTCECYGIQDVHIIEKENEFMIHKAISMGANKWLTLHNYPNEPNNVAACIRNLKADGYTIVATLPAENSTFMEDLPIDEKTAFLFGTELTGLSDEAVKLCDKSVKIPMYGFTESFNISNSVAILVSHMVERLRHSPINWGLSTDEKADLYFEWLCNSIRFVDDIIEDFMNQRLSHPQ